MPSYGVLHLMDGAPRSSLLATSSAAKPAMLPRNVQTQRPPANAHEVARCLMQRKAVRPRFDSADHMMKLEAARLEKARENLANMRNERRRSSISRPHQASLHVA
mmetsp:Transcript_2203/g.6952  ORF Transcript_2203/g.6952 Transcript_2203/m.6952 type:complete len:105 (-) Transcript_2203:746-1060(-)